MNRRLVIKTVAILALGLTLALPSDAQTSERSGMMLSAQRMAEERITSLMSGYDEDSLVFISFIPKVLETAKLPGTPFNVKALTIPFDNGWLPFATADVMIFTKTGQISKAASSAIADVLRPFAAELNVKTQKLPAGYVSPFARQAKERKQELENQRVWEEKVQKEQRVWETEQAKQAREQREHQNDRKGLADGLIKDYTETLNSGWQRLDRITIAIAASVGAIALLQAILFLASIVLNRKREKNLAQYVAKLSTAIESGGGNASASLPPMNLGVQQSPGAMPAQSGQNQETERQMLNDLDDKPLVALMTDCYWTETDSYAAFIWKSLTMSRRQHLMSLWPYMETYANFLTSLEENNAGWAQHPYYLNPLGLEMTNAEQLTEAVKQQPGLLAMLSPLRLNNLNLTALERIALEELAKEAKPGALPKLPPAKARLLSIRRNIAINSVDEEVALLDQNFSSDMAETIMSWIWSRGLSDQELESILERYSARDLASAWIAPSVVLDRLIKLMPSKKRDLLLTMLERQKPNRGNIYLAIYRDMLALLRSKAKDDAETPNAFDEVQQSA